MKDRIVLGDIAKALGVSNTTVSRAISGAGRVSKETRERVLKYVEATGFVPNASASNLSMSRTKNIAYSMPLRETAVISSYFSECLFGVCRVATEKGYHVIVVDDTVEELNRVAASRKVDGLVLSLFNHGDDVIRKLAGHGLPVALTGSTAVDGVLQVSYDARAAFRQLTNYLLNTWPGELGLILTQKGFPANETRAEGFRDAMTAHGIMQPHICWDAYDNKLMLQSMVSLYRKGVYGTVCGDDSICADLLSALSLCKYSDDPDMRHMAEVMRLASFHSSRFLQVFHPEIPTVIMDPMKLGEFAAQLLIYELEEGGIPASTMIDYQLNLP